MSSERSSEFEAKLNELNKQVSEANTRIKRCEQILRDSPAFVKVAHGRVFWNPETKRICMDGKPLIEHKLGVRVKEQWAAEILVDLAVTAALEAVEAGTETA
jgi:antirestriction protein ArdC